MKKVSISAAVFAPAAIGFMSACVTLTANTAPHEPLFRSDALPDIGTKMPDGRIYAGLSMATGKPSYVAAAGGKKPDGTVYAGFSPDKNKDLYTTPADAPGVYKWGNAIEYCKTLSASGHHDWRMPTLGELAVQFNNRADIGGFNETGRMKNAIGYYWSSLQVGDNDAWSRRFSDGYHEDFSKNDDLLLRCVR